MKRLDEGAADSRRQDRIMIDRATRHEFRVPFRYRIAGNEDWSHGETINMSESGVLFSSDELLEVEASLEITFQTTGALLLERATRRAQVVRRTLNNWPETRLIFAAKFCL
ncbi:MAG TPA: PilZ domain-containing protein [Candidatus Angelobacter sp.]|nr:PilZ domain-containing protein [Candidatus Angelobacter sp.]